MPLLRWTGVVAYITRDNIIQVSNVIKLAQEFSSTFRYIPAH